MSTSHSRSKKILQIASYSYTRNNSNIKVNTPDNTKLLNELENYNFNLDIESIDQFIILDDNGNNNVSSNSNCIYDFNNYDTNVPVSFDSNLEKFVDDSININSCKHNVLTPDNEGSLDVDDVIPVSLINYNTNLNIDNGDNINITTNPIPNKNAVFTDTEQSLEVEVFGKKKRKKDDRVVNKLNREKGLCYKKIKQDNSIELVEKRK